MISLFDLLGVLLGLYTAYSAAVGTVFVKHRAWGRRLYRDEQPRQFWTSIAIYAVLSAALIVYF